MSDAHQATPKYSSKSPGGAFQVAAAVSSNMAFAVYRPLAPLVPEATRDALFQLFCDLRANVPKNERFFKRHARALAPTTPVGWLAIVGLAGYTLSAFLVISTCTLGISAAGVSIVALFLMGAGIFLASALSFMAVCFITSSMVAATLAAAALTSYFFLAMALAVARRLGGLAEAAAQYGKIFSDGHYGSTAVALLEQKKGDEMKHISGASSQPHAASQPANNLSPASECFSAEASATLNTATAAQSGNITAPATLRPIKTTLPEKQKPASRFAKEASPDAYTSLSAQESPASGTPSAAVNGKSEIEKGKGS